MLRKIPSSVQLPGGIRLDGIKFRITGYDEEGRPKTFEILSPGDESTEGVWTLYAVEALIRKPNQTVDASEKQNK